MQTSITLPEISLQLDVDEVLKYVHRLSDGAVILGGTLIEGIGNRLSDLDLYVICDSRPLLGDISAANHAFTQTRDHNLCTTVNDPVFLTTDFYKDSPHHLEVEYWTKAEVANVLRKLEREHALLMNHADCSYTTGGISREEQLLIHRVRTGTILIPGSGLDALVEDHYGMSSHILFRSVHNHYWAFQDIAGAADCGDWAMFRDQAREFLTREARAFTYATGNTNPTPKWLFSYLKASAASESYSLMDRVAEHLLYGGAIRDHYAYAGKCFVLIDEIEQALRPILDNASHFPTCEQFLTMLNAEECRRIGTDGVAQRHELAFRRKSYGDTRVSYKDLLKSL